MMPDFADQGAEVETQLRDAALRDQQLRAAADVAARPNGLCKDCGEAIAPMRLKAKPNALRCFDCQWLVERERAQHR